MLQRTSASGAKPQTTGPTARRALGAVGNRLHTGEGGLTLVEVLVAVTILTFGLLALASVSIASTVSLRDARLRQRATEAAALALDAARTLDYGDLANDDDDPIISITTFDPDGAATCLQSETVLYGAAGAVAGTGFVSGPAQPSHTDLQVRTYVTDVERLECGGTDLLTPAKRVTVVVSWKSGPGAAAAVRELRKSTVIALSERGNGTPEFDVAPVTGATTGPIGIQCLPHTLTNQGMDDSYEIVVPDLPFGMTLTLYVDSDGDNQGDVGEELDVVGGVPRTEGVGTGESVPLLFCYSLLEPNETVEPRPVVRSFYLQTLAVTLAHSVTTTGSIDLWLHTGERNDIDEDRLVLDPNPPEQELPVFAMNRVEPATTPGLFNDDRDIDPVPGLLLPRVAGPEPPDGDGNDYTSAWHGRWDYQMAQPLTIDGEGQIDLYVSTAIGLEGGVSKVALRWRLLRVSAEHDVLELVSAGMDSFETDGSGWQLRQLPFAALATTFDTHEWLRLELVCDALESEEDCHVATDTPAFPARVQVPLT